MHAHEPRLEIDVAPAKREELAAAKAERGGDEENVARLRPCHVHELLDLLAARRNDLPLAHGRHGDAARRVGRNETFVECVREERFQRDEHVADRVRGHAFRSTRGDERANVRTGDTGERHVAELGLGTLELALVVAVDTGRPERALVRGCWRIFSFARSLIWPIADTAFREPSSDGGELEGKAAAEL
jgi:hypothetical protein